MNKKPISIGYSIFIILIAAFFDALSFVPGISEGSAIIGQIVIGILFYLAGTSVWRDKATILYGAATVIELVPGASALPMFLIESIALILISRRRSK